MRLAFLWQRTFHFGNRALWLTAGAWLGFGVEAPALGGGETAAPPAAAQAAVEPFSFETVREQARALAAKEYHPDTGADLPDFLKKLNYDEYQMIHYRAGQGPWSGEHLPFSLQFFHRGYLYADPVRIHLIEDGRVHHFQFSAQQFDYGTNRFPKALPTNLHFAGLRVLYPLNRPDKLDEVATFIGATYFRQLGERQRYGAAGRGLALDTAEPSGEEFPRFTEFWIHKPDKPARQLEVFALLDSASAAGAYRFLIKPGEATAIDVEASLFPRKEIKKLGLAPLTSMFLMGENRTQFIPDFRPEIHDSDGLLLRSAAGECQWRPLVDPQKQHHVSRFPMEALGGFGLMQRDRSFQDYEDLAARYELRPSLWVEPRDNWGPGAVELVEIPTTTEWNDNIVAYWVPEQKAVPGHEFHWTYTISALMGEPECQPRLLVESTRINPEHDKSPPRFLIDFVGSTPGLITNPVLEAKIELSQGEARNLVVQTNEATGGWRAFFDLVGTSSQPTDLRLWLRDSGRVVSETWVYHFQKP